MINDHEKKIRMSEAMKAAHRKRLGLRYRGDMTHEEKIVARRAAAKKYYWKKVWKAVAEASLHENS